MSVECSIDAGVAVKGFNNPVPFAGTCIVGNCIPAKIDIDQPVKIVG